MWTAAASTRPPACCALAFNIDGPAILTLIQHSQNPSSPDIFRRRVRWALGVMRRGKWVLMGCMLLVTGPTILYLYKAERLYTAEAEILVEAPEIGDNLLERSYGKSRLTESAIQTEADILASGSLTAKVIDKLGLDRDPEFNLALRPRSQWGKIISTINPLPYLTGQQANEQVLSPQGKETFAKTRTQGMFQSRLSVKSRRRSFVITISFSANNSEKAALIANTLGEIYVLDRLENSLDETRRANEWLAKRLEELRHDVAAAEQAAERFRVAHDLAQLRKGERQLTIIDQQLIELNSRLVLARSDLAQKQARHNQLQRLQRNRGSVETSYDVLQSSLIQRLREQESLKQRELSEAMKTYGDRHPRIIGQRADLEELRSKISQEVVKIAASLATEVETSRAGISSLERQIDDLQRNTNKAGGHEVELRELERQADTSRSLYESFLGRYKRDAEQEFIQRANARVLSQAAIPTRPSSPRRLRIFAGALLFSLLAGTGLVFLLDRLNGRIRSAEEAEQITGLPILATIPFWKTAGKDGAGLTFAILDSPRSHLANAFRSLRAVLTAVSSSGTDKVTLITSSIPQEGKSFVTRNLAMAVAASGKRVLIIDADLMRPTQHLPLGLSPRHGLTQALSDAAISPAALLLRDERANLDILPAGLVDLDSGNALTNGRLESIVEALAGRYDQIFIDGPPSLAATDAQILAKVAGRTLLVVKWNHTPRDAIATALSYLAKVGAPICGIVLTQISASYGRTESYGAYGYYGAYQSYAESQR